MQYKHSKADRRLIRNLAGIAWERQLREELAKIGDVIAEMMSGNLTPFDANEHVHEFHNGISRELYNFYSVSDPWIGVCRAHYDGVLTENDISEASDNVREGLQQFADSFRRIQAIETSTTDDNG